MAPQKTTNCHSSMNPLGKRGLGPLKPVSKLNPLKQLKPTSSPPEKTNKIKKKTGPKTPTQDPVVVAVPQEPQELDAPNDSSEDDEYGSDAWDESEANRETKRETKVESITTQAADTTTVTADSDNSETMHNNTNNNTSNNNTPNDSLNVSRQSTRSTSSTRSRNTTAAASSSSASFTKPSLAGRQRLSSNVQRRLLALDQGGAVSLADACLGDYGCKAVADTLPSSSVTSLDLRGNQIRDEGNHNKGTPR